jgi:hypothetical protein
VVAATIMPTAKKVLSFRVCAGPVGMTRNVTLDGLIGMNTY